MGKSDSIKPSLKEFGTVAVLPFHGYRGGELVRYIKREMKDRGVTVVELQDLGKDAPKPELDKFDRKVSKLLKGRNLEGIDHIVTGQLISRPLMPALLAGSKSLVIGARMEVISTASGKVVARADLKRDTAYLHGGPEDVSDDSDVLPDTAARLIVTLRWDEQSIKD
ncbi:MAG: hypothetical protein AB3N64_14965 [Puniceicoccaceae bacterium]